MKPRAIVLFIFHVLPPRFCAALRTLCGICLYLFASMGAAPACADVFSSASASGLSIALYDLDPGDGITPSISFAAPGFSSYLYAVASSNGAGHETAVIDKVWPIAGGLGGNVATALARTGVVIEGAASGFPSAAASGAAQAQAGNSANYAALARMPDLTIDGFTLSPHTLAYFSAFAVTNASTTIGYDPLTGRTESATASVSMGVYGISALGSYGYQVSEAYLAANAAYHLDGGGWVAEADRNAGLLGITFSNLSDFRLGGTFYTGIDIGGVTMLPFEAARGASAVPEHEAWILFVVGIGLTAGLIISTARRGQWS